MRGSQGEVCRSAGREQKTFGTATVRELVCVTRVVFESFGLFTFYQERER